MRARVLGLLAIAGLVGVTSSTGASSAVQRSKNTSRPVAGIQQERAFARRFVEMIRHGDANAARNVIAPDAPIPADWLALEIARWKDARVTLGATTRVEGAEVRIAYVAVTHPRPHWTATDTGVFIADLGLRRNRLVVETFISKTKLSSLHWHA